MLRYNHYSQSVIRSQRLGQEELGSRVWVSSLGLPEPQINHLHLEGHV